VQRPPLACVLGDTDLIRPLGRAGLRCAAVGRPDSPKAYSRFVDVRIEWADNWTDRAGMLRNLVEFAARQATPPILFFQYDGDLLFVSRNRGELAPHFRFAIAGAELIERLVDKPRFHELALERELSVPPTTSLRPAEQPDPPVLELDFPIVLKPATRRDPVWRPLGGRAKALWVESPRALAGLWPRLATAGLDLVAQEHVEGGEERVESYHAYVDPGGAVVGEFTGRKIRTRPACFGQTTALEITDAPDIRDLGRRAMADLGLTGVAKLDFKRTAAGRLVLLEVNPRFNLWHLPGAAAGVNLPGLVYADLAGLPRPPAREACAGVRWSLPWHDFAAAREQGMSLRDWIAWQSRCETRHIVARDDPMPFVRGVAWRRAKRRLSARTT
jgi:predicted ATP-grasp superfamily ATP-dependent carboligase